jgi:hypothetical protein
MDKLVILYHGGSVASDDYRNVQFVRMQMMPLVFRPRSSLSELVAQSREKLHWDANEEGIVVEGLLHFGLKETILRHMFLICCEDEWEDYVTLVMSNEVKCLDLFVQKVSIDPNLHKHSPKLGNSALFDPLLLNVEVDVEDVPEVESPSLVLVINDTQLLMPL